MKEDKKELFSFEHVNLKRFFGNWDDRNLKKSKRIIQINQLLQLHLKLKSLRTFIIEIHLQLQKKYNEKPKSHFHFARKRCQNL